MRASWTNWTRSLAGCIAAIGWICTPAAITAQDAPPERDAAVLSVVLNRLTAYRSGIVGNGFLLSSRRVCLPSDQSCNGTWREDGLPNAAANIAKAVSSGRARLVETVAIGDKRHPGRSYPRGERLPLVGFAPVRVHDGRVRADLMLIYPPLEGSDGEPRTEYIGFVLVVENGKYKITEIIGVIG